MKLSVVVPVFNSVAKLEELVKEVETQISTNFKWEIIFVYDCGLADSWEEIKKLVKIFPGKVRGLRLAKNLGQHSAIIYGFGVCKGDLIATMDEDIQNDPADLLKLIKKQQETGAQIIYGYARDNGNGFVRNFLSQLLRVILFASISGISYYYSSFRLLEKQIALRICEMQTRYPFIDAMIAKLSVKKGYLSVKRIKRKADKSNYSLLKLINHTIKIFIEYTKNIDIFISFLIIIISGIFIAELVNNKSLFVKSVFFNIGILILLLMSVSGFFLLRFYRKKLIIRDYRFILEII